MRQFLSAVMNVTCLVAVLSCDTDSDTGLGASTVETPAAAPRERRDLPFEFDENASIRPENMDRFLGEGEVTVERMHVVLGRAAGLSDFGLYGLCFLYPAPPDFLYAVAVEAGDGVQGEAAADEVDAFFRSLVITRVWGLSSAEDSETAEILWSAGPPAVAGSPDSVIFDARLEAIEMTRRFDESTIRTGVDPRFRVEVVLLTDAEGLGRAGDTVRFAVHSPARNLRTGAGGEEIGKTMRLKLTRNAGNGFKYLERLAIEDTRPERPTPR